MTKTTHFDCPNSVERGGLRRAALCKNATNGGKELIVEPSSRSQNRSLASQVQEALDSVEALRDEEIRVTVKGKTVILSGRVDDTELRHQAQKIVREFPFDVVLDQIRVGKL